MNPTDAVVDFVSEADLDDFPSEALRLGKRAILDTLGVSIAGARDESVCILLEATQDRDGKPTAGIIGGGIRTDCLTAALVNGTMAHALDFDDVNDSMMGHPSAPLVPAVMALGEEVGASGSQVLEAFLVGFEVECKLGLAVGRGHYVKGWHATSTLGTIGAAAAASRILGLDRDRVRMALGIAASMSGGIRLNFGTMTKPLHVGQAARNGIQAAVLAQKGFTGTADVFGAPLNFCEVFSVDGSEANQHFSSIGSPWEILFSGITVKKYPCCNNTHRTLDAALDIAKGHRPIAEDIAKVELTMPPGEDMALIYSKATTGLEGKFCMQYCVAAALLDGKIDPSTFENQQVHRPEVQELSGKVQLIADHQQKTVVVEGGGHVEVKVVMKGGEEYVQKASDARGSAQNPLSQEELVDKYTACARNVLTPELISRSVEMVDRLEDLPDVRELMGSVCLTSPVAAKRPVTGS